MKDYDCKSSLTKTKFGQAQRRQIKKRKGGKGSTLGIAPIMRHGAARQTGHRQGTVLDDNLRRFVKKAFFRRVLRKA